jgi:hypothetical protein
VWPLGQAIMAASTQMMASSAAILSCNHRAVPRKSARSTPAASARSQSRRESSRLWANQGKYPGATFRTMSRSEINGRTRGPPDIRMSLESRRPAPPEPLHQAGNPHKYRESVPAPGVCTTQLPDLRAACGSRMCERRRRPPSQAARRGRPRQRLPVGLPRLAKAPPRERAPREHAIGPRGEGSASHAGKTARARPVANRVAGRAHAVRYPSAVTSTQSSTGSRRPRKGPTTAASRPTARPMETGIPSHAVSALMSLTDARRWRPARSTARSAMPETAGVSA